MDLAESNFTKHPVAQRIFLVISCIECYPKQKKTIEHSVRFHLRPKVMCAVYLVNVRKQ